MRHSGGGGGETWSEVELGKKRGVGGMCFKICFYISLSYSDLICNKSNQFPQVNSVLPVTIIAE